MKTFLLILSIAMIVLGVLSLFLGAFSLYAYHNVMDGSKELYKRLKNRATLFIPVGIALMVAGAILLVVRKR